MDKGLEVEIAKTFYGWDNAFTPPRDRIEEYRGIDLWVNETPVQIKCNKDSKLYLEDNLFRNGEWMAGYGDDDRTGKVWYLNFYRVCPHCNQETFKDNIFLDIEEEYTRYGEVINRR